MSGLTICMISAACWSSVFLRLVRDGILPLVSLMSDYDDFRRKSEHALTCAERAETLADASMWLQIAENWLQKIPLAEATPEQLFDAAARKHGTGQDGSGSLH